jgi:hypothetical protein
VQACYGFSVFPYICDEHDTLDLQQIKSVINYIVKLYQECHNKKAISGEHDHFGAYVGK